MDVRERLIELLKTNACPASYMCDPACRYYGFEDCFPDRFADHLIAHGVAIQEWISVKDRLPEEGEYVLCVLKGFNYGGKIQVCKFVPADKFKDKPYFEHFRNGFPSVTHWMPLPKLPKGE